MLKLRYSTKGNPIITKDLQKAVRKTVQVRGLHYTSDQLGVDIEVVGQILVKDFPRKSRGISASDIKATMRTARKVGRMSKELGIEEPPKRKPRRAAKPADKVTVINIRN